MNARADAPRSRTRPGSENRELRTEAPLRRSPHPSPAPSCGRPRIEKRPGFIANPGLFSEREKGLELSTPTLARWHSTTELLPRKWAGKLSDIAARRKGADRQRGGMRVR